jgi:hypothetical protein
MHLLASRILTRKPPQSLISLAHDPMASSICSQARSQLFPLKQTRLASAALRTATTCARAKTAGPFSNIRSRSKQNYHIRAVSTITPTSRLTRSASDACSGRRTYSGQAVTSQEDAMADGEVIAPEYLDEAERGIFDQLKEGFAPTALEVSFL